MVNLSHEPFQRVFDRPPGMVPARPFKDDPRYRGEMLKTPSIAREVELRPNILLLLPRVVLWSIVWLIFKDQPFLGTAGNKFVFFTLGILDLGFGIPKFIFERTILTQEGIKRLFLYYEMFFRWDEIHQLNRDSLSLSFRIRKGWGIWLDEFNIIISRFYYTAEDIRKVAQYFAGVNGDAKKMPEHDYQNLLDLNS